MGSVSHRRIGARRIALALACSGLAAASLGVLADAGQARDIVAGGMPRSHPSRVAGAATSAIAGSRLRGMSRAAGALYAATGQRPASVTLEKCVTAAARSESFAVFTGRMSAVPGATGMAMRIGIEVRTPEEPFFHPLEGNVAATGSWRTSEPGVKIFKDLKQVSNLSGPADYRGVVRFRWTSSKGALVKREVLRTTPCHQPAPEVQAGSGEASTARMTER